MGDCDNMCPGYGICYHGDILEIELSGFSGGQTWEDNSEFDDTEYNCDLEGYYGGPYCWEFVYFDNCTYTIPDLSYLNGTYKVQHTYTSAGNEYWHKYFRSVIDTPTGAEDVKMCLHYIYRYDQIAQICTTEQMFTLSCPVEIEVEYESGVRVDGVSDPYYYYQDISTDTYHVEGCTLYGSSPPCSEYGYDPRKSAAGTLSLIPHQLRFRYGFNGSYYLYAQPGMGIYSRRTGDKSSNLSDPISCSNTLYHYPGGSAAQTDAFVTALHPSWIPGAYPNEAFQITNMTWVPDP